MGYTREFITPQIEVVRVDEAFTVEEAREWADVRLAHVQQIGRDEIYGLLIDVSAMTRIPLQVMMVMVDLVSRAGETRGYIALTGASRVTNTMAEAVMRMIPGRLERFRVFEAYEEALAWVRTVLE